MSIASASLRTNDEWLAELHGARGIARQTAAHHALANYLYIVAHNYLHQRQHDPALLSTLDPQELAALAQDFVQDALFKLAQDNFALLAQFRNEGNFTSWCAKLLCNLIASELRRPFWRKRRPEATEDEWVTTRSPEQTTQIGYIREIIDRCIQELQERRRIAFEQCIVQDLPTDQVADRLATSVSGIYQLVFYARRDLRLCLDNHGIDMETMAVFRE